MRFNVDDAKGKHLTIVIRPGRIVLNRIRRTVFSDENLFWCRFDFQFCFIQFKKHQISNWRESKSTAWMSQVVFIQVSYNEYFSRVLQNQKNFYSTIGTIISSFRSLLYYYDLLFQ